MRIRAVIFNVYGTLLHVGPPPGDAAARWRWLWENSLGRRPRLDLETFDVEVQASVAREKARAAACGIQYPEVYWPEVLNEVAPEFRTLPRDARRGFEVAQARLARTTALMAGSGSVLRLLLTSGVVLGIAANSQPYTVRELDEALSAVGLGADVFQEDVAFWSYRHGFAKPDPHVFRLLSARLRARGILPSEVLMVSNELDLDLRPAIAFGWLAYQLRFDRGDSALPGGEWHSLAGWLDGRLPG
ncbi:MAG: HAD family hydrolase [Verrucomicrobiales bacterium]|nr:HAD family hydrolase [Verrucomicrobiales bacterium]